MDDGAEQGAAKPRGAEGRPAKSGPTESAARTADRPTDPVPAKSTPDASSERPDSASSEPPAAPVPPGPPAGTGPPERPADSTPRERPPDPVPPEQTADAPTAPEAAEQPAEAGLSELADKVQGLLEAAEATAQAIREEARADATRVEAERRRQREAAREARHLYRLADALTVQAEMVKRQCSVLDSLLDPEGGEEPPEATADLPPGGERAPATGEQESRARQSAPNRPSSLERPSPSGPDPAPPVLQEPERRPQGARPGPEAVAPSSTGGGAGGPSPPAEPGTSAPVAMRSSATEQVESVPEPQIEDIDPGRRKNGHATPPGIKRERVEAYRMKLAGATREEVERYLGDAGVEEPRKVAAQIFASLTIRRPGPERAR